MRWEYKAQLLGPAAHIVTICNHLGMDGWELAASVPSQIANCQTLIFKRRVA